MKIYKEIKEIAKCMSKINFLVEKAVDKGLSVEGVYWHTAELVSLDKKEIQYFKSHGDETEDYFVSQNCGMCGDDFYGHLYFKTDVPGQYVKVYFEC